MVEGPGGTCDDYFVLKTLEGLWWENQTEQIGGCLNDFLLLVVVEVTHESLSFVFFWHPLNSGCFRLAGVPVITFIPTKKSWGGQIDLVQRIMLGSSCSRIHKNIKILAYSAGFQPPHRLLPLMMKNYVVLRPW